MAVGCGQCSVVRTRRRSRLNMSIEAGCGDFEKWRWTCVNVEARSRLSRRCRFVFVAAEVCWVV